MPNHIIPVGTLFAYASKPLGIPGVATDELKISFLQATAPLPRDIQELIWKEVLYCTVPVEAPPTPEKCSVSYTRLSTFLNRSRKIRYSSDA